MDQSIPRLVQRIARVLLRSHHNQITSCFHLPLMAMNVRSGGGKCGHSRAVNDEELSTLVPSAAFQAQTTLSHSVLFFLPSLSFPDNDDGDSSWHWWMQHSWNAAWINQSMGYLHMQLEHSIPALFLIPLFPSLLFGLPWEETRKMHGRHMVLVWWVFRFVFSKQLQGSLENSIGLQPSAITLTVLLSPGKGDKLRCHSGSGVQSEFLQHCLSRVSHGKHGWEAPASLSPSSPPLARIQALWVLFSNLLFGNYHIFLSPLIHFLCSTRTES